MVRTTGPRDVTRFRSNPATLQKIPRHQHHLRSAGFARWSKSGSKHRRFVDTKAKAPDIAVRSFFDAQKDETPDIAVGGLQEKSGGVLLSHKVSLAVPLALASLTSEFEMGSGVTSPL